MERLIWLGVVGSVLLGCGGGGGSTTDAGFFEDPATEATGMATPSASSTSTGDGADDLDTSEPPATTNSTNPATTNPGDSTDDGGSTDDGPPGTDESGTTGPGTDDGPPPACDPVPPGMGECPAECTGGCDGGTCTIACGSNECNGGVVCPDGWPCVVSCTGDNSCNNSTITCGDSGCEITCSGINACLATAITCGPQACSVMCSGPAGSPSAFDCAACSCMNGC